MNSRPILNPGVEPDADAKQRMLDGILTKARKNNLIYQNEDILNIQKLTYRYTPHRPRKALAGLLAATLVIAAFSASALAARFFLKPGEIVNRVGNQSLSVAFESGSAINVNTSITSGDYIFTLLAIVSGKDITDDPFFSLTVRDERSYAVLVVEKNDRTLFSLSPEEQLNNRFYVTPLVNGLNPELYNAVAMNASNRMTVEDGILYIVMECDGIEMFADRGLYFAVCKGWHYESGAFIWDEETGDVKANPDFIGGSAVFDLPIDKSLANPEKANEWLENNQISSVIYSESTPIVIYNEPMPNE
jgi:hypothetical protein